MPDPSGDDVVATPWCDPCRLVVNGDAFTLESSVAVSPLDENHIVIASLNDPHIDVYASHDGGHTWVRGSLPMGSSAPAGHHLQDMLYSFDPFVTILPDGAVLVGGIVVRNVASQRQPVDLFTSRSTDGGLNFGDIAILHQGRIEHQPTGSQWTRRFPDMPKIAVASDGTVAVGFTTMSSYEFDPRPERLLDDGGDPLTMMQTVASEATRPVSDLSLWFTTSADGGKAWASPVQIHAGSSTDFAYPGQPLPRKDGSWTILAARANYGELTRFDSEGGAVWTERRLPGIRPMEWAVAAIGPGPAGERLFLMHLEPASDIQPWPAPTYPRPEEGHWPALSWSDDDGATWTTIRLAETPSVAPILLPSLAVDGQGNAYTSFLHEPEEDAPMTMRAVQVTSDGDVLAHVLEGGLDGFTRGHYNGLATGNTWTAATWNTGAFPDFRVAFARLS